MGFRQLLDRVRERLREQVRNGHLTERELARRLALSQPHIHNVLKGERILTPDLADLILSFLGIDVLDLLSTEDLRRPPGRAASSGNRAATVRERSGNRMEQSR